MICGSHFSGEKDHTVIILYCQDKDEYNIENRYNQNFDGVYCTCSRPYPDPEDEVSQNS